MCGRRCRGPAELIIHMRIHNKEKPFSCSICKLKSFAQRSQLNDHVNNVHFSISGQQENTKVFQKLFSRTHSQGTADSTEDNEAISKECPLNSVPLATSIVDDVAEELSYHMPDNDPNSRLEDNTNNKKHLNLDVVWGNEQLHLSHDLASSKEKSKDRSSIGVKETTEMKSKDRKLKDALVVQITDHCKEYRPSSSDIIGAKEDISNLSKSKR